MARVGVWLTNYAAEGSNNERVLPAAISSVLSQSFTDFKLYIFDNHSPSQKVRTAIQDAAAADPRVVPVEVPQGLAGIPLANHAWKFLDKQDHDYTITIGGHDFWNTTDHLKNLVETMDEGNIANPERVALVYTDTWQVNEKDEVCSRYQDINQIAQIPRLFIPLVVISTVNSPQFFGLWNEKIRKKTPIRHECAGFDHLIVMEAATKGAIMWDPRSPLVMRAPPPTDHMGLYGQRHLSPETLKQGSLDYVKQLEWLLYCQELCFPPVSEHMPAPARDMFVTLLTCAIGAVYMALRGTNLHTVPGAFKEFGENPAVAEAFKGFTHAANQLRRIVYPGKPKNLT